MAISSYATGLVFLVLVAAIWAGASVLVQYIYSDLGFSSPFFLTYFCTTLFSLYLPLYASLVATGLAQSVPWDACQLSASNSDCVPLKDSEDSSTNPHLDHDSLASEECTHDTSRLSHVYVVRSALLICPLWFIANFAYYVSLAHTSVSSNTVISTTSSIFTFGFSYLFKLEQFHWGKVVGVLLCMLGTTLVALEDEADQRNTLWGDFIALFAAMMYGLYTTAMRHCVIDDSSFPMQLLFGYIGLINGLAFGCILIILYTSGTIRLDGLNGQIIGWLSLNAIFDNVVADYLWARAVILTSPTVATVGLSLTIPLAFISDFFVESRSPSVLTGLGAVFVVGGFVLVNTGVQPLLTYVKACLAWMPLKCMHPTIYSHVQETEHSYKSNAL